MAQHVRKSRFNLWIEDDLFKRLSKEARKQHRSRASLIGYILDQHLPKDNSVSNAEEQLTGKADRQTDSD